LTSTWEASGKPWAGDANRPGIRLTSGGAWSKLYALDDNSGGISLGDLPTRASLSRLWGLPAAKPRAAAALAAR